jgi:hypothetical protein
MVVGQGGVDGLHGRLGLDDLRALRLDLLAPGPLLEQTQLLPGLRLLAARDFDAHGSLVQALARDGAALEQTSCALEIPFGIEQFLVHRIHGGAALRQFLGPGATFQLGELGAAGVHVCDRLRPFRLDLGAIEARQLRAGTDAIPFADEDGLDAARGREAELPFRGLDGAGRNQHIRRVGRRAIPEPVTRGDVRRGRQRRVSG